VRCPRGSCATDQSLPLRRNKATNARPATRARTARPDRAGMPSGEGVTASVRLPERVGMLWSTTAIVWLPSVKNEAARSFPPASAAVKVKPMGSRAKGSDDEKCTVPVYVKSRAPSASNATTARGKAAPIITDDGGPGCVAGQTETAHGSFVNKSRTAVDASSECRAATAERTVTQITIFAFPQSFEKRRAPDGCRASGERRGEAEERVRSTRGLGGKLLHPFVPRPRPAVIELEPPIGPENETRSLLTCRRGLVADDLVSRYGIGQVHDLDPISQLDRVLEAPIRGEVDRHALEIGRPFRMDQTPPTDQTRRHRPCPFVQPDGWRVSAKR